MPDDLSRLSTHFTLAELTASATARQLGLDNRPGPVTLRNLRTLAAGLERVRAILGGVPIRVSSGYRAPAVNAAVGGSPTSGHILGLAADFTAPAFGGPLAICRALVASDLAFDQVLEEGTWVHLSFDPRLRRQALTKTRGGFVHGLRHD